MSDRYEEGYRCGYETASDEAADEIERLRSALEEIAEARSVEDEWCGDIAREALDGKT